MPYEIEDLLSTEFWKLLIENNWVKERPYSDYFEAFGGSFSTLDQTINDIINSKVPEEDIRNTIVRYQPVDEHKTQIVGLLKKQMDLKAVTQGLAKTVEKLSQYFM